MNIKEAITKTCPFSMSMSVTVEGGAGVRACKADRCMAWVQNVESYIDNDVCRPVYSETAGYCGMMPSNITVEADVSN